MQLTRRTLLSTAAATLVAGALGTGPAGAAPQARVGASWMAGLPDGRSLLRMTIPGTHDSCCTDPANGTEWSHTQNWGVPEQLERGIRFLDIRCNGLAGAPDAFGIYHSGWYQGTTFDQVLNQCRSFLAAHPGEVLLMRVKKENGTNNDVGADFARIFNGYLDTKGYRPLFWTAPRVPALGEARGRIVLLADFANDWPVLHWPGGDNGFLSNDVIDLQDRYTAISSGTKWSSYVQRQFDKAFNDQGSAKLYLNFASIGNGEWPKYSSQTVMQKVWEYLEARKQQRANLGVVPMDFPDFHTNALQLLIDKNFI
ncbi:phosphatidylinositol-specific phospholipase C [Kitasatospora sp. NPDC002040]|uniref:phosphatidylinositol-specific phospholipase C n=1 Tax=Kitasatospora sp. NPDC002040 TaxID=3154661 RepID=UPI0033185E8E